MSRDLPYYTIKILPEGRTKGEPYDGAGEVLEFAVDEDLKKAAKLAITVDNHDLSHFDNPRWKKGNILAVQWGYLHDTTEPEEFLIRSVKGGRVLQIEAHSKGMLLNRVSKPRVFENMKRSDIASKIAKEHGYTPEEIDVQDTKRKYRVIPQGKLSDAQFLKKLAHREGFDFYVDGTGFHFRPRDLKQKPIKTLTYFTSQQGDILDFDVETDLTAKPGKVTLKGVDPLNKKKLSESADNSSDDRDGLGGVLEVVDRVSGETSLQSRVVQEEVSHTTETSEDAAKAHADAKHKDVQHRAVKLTITAVGDPVLRKGKIIAVEGISRRLSGKYLITGALHRISTGGGYTVDLECKSDGSNGFGNAKDSKSDAKTNDKKAPAAGEEKEITPFEKVDTRSGETRIGWR